LSHRLDLERAAGSVGTASRVPTLSHLSHRGIDLDAAPAEDLGEVPAGLLGVGHAAGHRCPIS
jgi:hypothetical protein